NEWHGTAFYQGQYPWANALENRVIRSINLGRNHMYGGTVGHPILKNKLFNFVAYEGWKQTDPQSLLNTLPTDLERQGDFSQSIKFPFQNFSDRVDYQATERLRASGRVSLFRTPITTSNPTGSDYFVSDRGSERDATSITGDVTYTLSARTVINVRGDYHSFIDAAKYATSFADGGGWAKIWPNSSFYKQVFADPAVPVELPRMSISGTDGSRNFNMGPGGGYWDQRPTSDSFDVKIAQQRGSHYLKAGFETRGSRSPQRIILSNPGFGFDAAPTNSTYVNPNTLLSGDGFATFLLGAVTPTSGGPSDWDSSSTSMPVINFLNP